MTGQVPSDRNGRRPYSAFLDTQNVTPQNSNKVQAVLSVEKTAQLELLPLEKTALGILPIEMFFKILEFLPLKDTLSLAQVCSVIRSICHLKLDAVGCSLGERYRVSVNFKDAFLNRIISLGLQHLVSSLTLHRCPQENDLIANKLRDFSNLTQVIIHQQIKNRVERKIEVRRRNGIVREFNYSVIRGEDKEYNFRLNLKLRRIIFVLNHEWRYDLSSASSRVVKVMTAIGTVSLRQSHIKPNKELVIDIVTDKKIKVNFNVDRVDGEIFVTHEETYEHS